MWTLQFYFKPLIGGDFSVLLKVKAWQEVALIHLNMPCIHFSIMGIYIFVQLCHHEKLLVSRPSQSSHLLTIGHRHSKHGRGTWAHHWQPATQHQDNICQHWWMYQLPLPWWLGAAKVKCSPFWGFHKCMRWWFLDLSCILFILFIKFFQSIKRCIQKYSVCSCLYSGH